MPSLAQVRKLLITLRTLAEYLNEEEMHEIGQVLLKAEERLEKEAGDINAN